MVRSDSAKNHCHLLYYMTLHYNASTLHNLLMETQTQSELVQSERFQAVAADEQ